MSSATASPSPASTASSSGASLEPGAVGGVDDAAVEVAQAHPQDRARPRTVRAATPVERTVAFGGGEALAEVAPVELRLDDRVAISAAWARASSRPAALGLDAVGVRQEQADQHHGHEADRRVGGEESAMRWVAGDEFIL